MERACGGQKFSIDSNSYNGTKLDKTQNNQGSKNIKVFFSYVALVGQELEIIKDEALILFCKNSFSCRRFL